MSESKLNYAIRAPTIDDLHAVVALINDCDAIHCVHWAMIGDDRR
jgi:hypothetical protein